MKRLAKVVLWLLLGAIVNVAVAWSFAWHASNGSRIFTTEGAYGLFRNHRTINGVNWCRYIERRRGWIDIVQAECPRCGNLLMLHRGIDEREFNGMIPIDSASLGPDQLARALLGVDQHANADWIEFACGWPSLSLRYSYVCVFDWNQENGRDGGPIEIRSHETGVLQAPGDLAARFSHGLIPGAPVWPGFAINTALYAATLWLLMLGPFAMRRTLRCRRGRCIKCGYDLRAMAHEVCPECGKPIKVAQP